MTPPPPASSSPAQVIPFDQRKGKIWFDGKLVDWSSAQLHVLTHGLHYASGVFEGARAYRGRIFCLAEHSERLCQSAQMLGFRLPWGAAAIGAACMETLSTNNLQDAYVRPIAWRGSEMMGVSAQQTRIHLAIAVWPWPSYFDPAERRAGLRLDIAQWRRPAPDTAPCQSKATGLYMICTLARHQAEAKGYADALMLGWRGHVAETTGANIFFRKGERLHTPLPDCFLDGITRRSVMALARKAGVELVEREILPSELEDFEECFITGTAAEVTPVREIGPHRFQPGALGERLMADYSALVLAPSDYAGGRRRIAS